MPIYKPSELRQFLLELGANPKKTLSQNFLIDGNIIRKIVSTAQVGPSDRVLEIGPGPGSLTEALLQAGAHVTAIEKDSLLSNALQRLQTEDNRLQIFNDDIMEFPIEENMKGQKAKVIANLPYHLTTPILARLVPMHKTFSTLFVMVQEEVARRFVAQPKTSDYSSFTVFLNFFSNPKYAFTVSKHCFYPEPSVQSAVVSLELKAPPTIANQEQFFRTVREAFSQRRKMLRRSLHEMYGAEQVSAVLEQLNWNPNTRPEELSLDEWLTLFNRLIS